MHRLIPFLMACLFACLSHAEEAAPELGAAEAKYQEADRKLLDAAAAAGVKSRNSYAEALAALEKASLAKSDFALSLAVRDEKRRFATNPAPAGAPELSPNAQVRAMQEQYAASGKSTEEKLLRDRFNLLKSYIAYLEGQTSALQRQGRVEAALLARQLSAKVQPTFDFMLEQMAALSAEAAPAPALSSASATAPATPPATTLRPVPSRPLPTPPALVPGGATPKPLLSYSFGGEGKEFAASQGTAAEMNLGLERVGKRKGVLGNCARFPGGASGTVAKGPSLDGKSYTFMLWFNVSQKGSHGFFGINQEHPMAKCVGEGRKINVGWQGQSPNDGQLTVWVMDKKLEVPCELEWGVWKHLAVRYDANRKELAVYLDGKRAADKGMPPLEGSNGLRFWVGQLEHSSGYWWGLNGGLDEFQLHETALSDAQIAQTQQKEGATLAVPPKTERELEDWLVDTEWMYYNDTAFQSAVGGFHLKADNRVNMPWTNGEGYRWKAGGSRSVELLNGSGKKFLTLQLAPDFRSWSATAEGSNRSGKRLF